MNLLITPAVVVLLALAGRLRDDVRHRISGDGEAGASTLETVVIALGLLLAAGVAVAAITAAVNSRTEQIK